MTTDPMKNLPRLPQPEVKALSAELTPKLLAALRPDDYTDLPKSASFALKPLLRKTFALSKETSQNDVIRATVLLGVYGQHARAAAGASVLLELPTDQFWFPNNSVIMHSVAAAFFFAREAGSPEATILGPQAIRPEGYRPAAPVFEGRLLTRYLDSPFPYGEHRDAYPAWHTASGYLNSIANFIYLWLFGGSAEWPQARIEAEVERYRQAIFQEPGFAPPID